MNAGRPKRWGGFPGLGASIVLLVLMTPIPAHAEPAFARMYKQRYGYTPSCNACHKDGGGTPLNGFGERFKDAGMRMASFDQIASADSDGDGATNGEEAGAKSNPGSPRSTPVAKGDWLDTDSLIPREVQAQFPDVRAYLPRDALLTETDIARAQQLGAQLDPSDENTIYIPLLDRRPVGTAIIFPAEFQEKTFFLLMATDRKLQVIRVAPLNTRQVPQAERDPTYARFEGMALDKLPTAEGTDLSAAITRAVKKAGTLVFVRLKSG